MRIASGAFVALLLSFIFAGTALTGSEIPDLKGTWTGDFTIVRTTPRSGAGPNPLAFTKPGFQTAKGVTYVIDKQEGPVFSGTESYGKSKQTVVGVIRHNNKKVYMVDRYGTLVGKIVTPDTMQLVYLENSAHGQVAAQGTITRNSSTKQAETPKR